MRKYKMELFTEKEACYGCTACYASCPKRAISMIPDEEGFLYPSIDMAKCISCGKCRRVCPRKIPYKEHKPLGIYALKHICGDVREASTSGGGFTAVARWVEDRHGTIYGVDYDKKFCAVHRAAEKEKDWSAFRSSKYMQSILGDTIQQVLYDLEMGKWVLFTGTPCQVDGLYHALNGKNTDKLITCDLICHGTPSPRIWRDYLSYLQRNTLSVVGSVNFREKTERGWHNSTITIRNRAGRIMACEPHNQNPYSRLFFEKIIMRPSCHECQYANLSRPGDITLGDCWGIEKFFPEYDDNKGITLFMYNSQKGKLLWENIKSNTMYLELSEEQCLQPSLCYPASKGWNRDAYWADYKQHGFVKATLNCGFLPPSKATCVKYRVRSTLGKLKQKVFLQI